MTYLWHMTRHFEFVSIFLDIQWQLSQQTTILFTSMTWKSLKYSPVRLDLARSVISFENQADTEEVLRPPEIDTAQTVLRWCPCVRMEQADGLNGRTTISWTSEKLGEETRNRSDGASWKNWSDAVAQQC